MSYERLLWYMCVYIYSENTPHSRVRMWLTAQVLITGLTFTTYDLKHDSFFLVTTKKLLQTRKPHYR